MSEPRLKYIHRVIFLSAFPDQRPFPPFRLSFILEDLRQDWDATLNLYDYPHELSIPGFHVCPLSVPSVILR